MNCIEEFAADLAELIGTVISGFNSTSLCFSAASVTSNVMFFSTQETDRNCHFGFFAD